MVSCAVEGGCPSDYVAIAVSIVSFIVLLSWSIFPFLVHKVPRTKGSGFWIPVIQVVASFNLLLSIMMSNNFLKFGKRHWWQSCYVWAVWGEGPLGFGLLLSGRITQAFQLYFIFVKRRLPLIKSYFFFFRLFYFPGLLVLLRSSNSTQRSPESYGKFFADGDPLRIGGQRHGGVGGVHHCHHGWSIHQRY